MLCKASQTLAAHLILCVACGGPGKSAFSAAPGASPVMAPAQDLPRDQHIVLESLAVRSSALTPPAPSEASLQPPRPLPEHRDAEMMALARAGIADALLCQKDVGGEFLSEGELTLNLEIDQNGTVLGGNTHPAAGRAGLAAVAECFLARARTWKFPGRTRAGRTVLVAPYQFLAGEEQPD